MVTLSKTWYCDTNIIPSDQTTAANQYARLVLNFKLFLTGAAFYEDGVRVPDGSGAGGVWTVARSSNGVIATAADNWATVADIVRNTAGSAHSWIVLRSPVSTGFLPNPRFIEILIDCNTTTTENVTITFAEGLDPFAGGTTLNAPATPTNGINIGTVQIAENTVLANHRQHFWRNSEGDFFCTVSRDGSGAFGMMMYAWQGENGDAADVWPCSVNASFSGSLAANVVTHANLASASTNGGWSTDNTQNDSLPAILYAASGTVATTGFNASGGIPGRNPAVPIDLFQVVANLGLYHGRVPDIRYGSPNQANLTLESTADAWKRMNVGHLVIFKHDTDTLPIL